MFQFLDTVSNVPYSSKSRGSSLYEVLCTQCSCFPDSLYIQRWSRPLRETTVHFTFSIPTSERSRIELCPLSEASLRIHFWRRNLRLDLQDERLYWRSIILRDVGTLRMYFLFIVITTWIWTAFPKSGKSAPPARSTWSCSSLCRLDFYMLLHIIYLCGEVPLHAHDILVHKFRSIAVFASSIWMVASEAFSLPSRGCSAL